MEISEYEVRLEPEELRNIIKGKTETRKCPDCGTAGKIWTLHYVLANDPDQDNEQFKEVSDQFAADFDEDNLPPEYSYGECYLYDCDTCKGVGYILIQEY
jgi:hypothetical protein